MKLCAPSVTSICVIFLSQSRNCGSSAAAVIGRETQGNASRSNVPRQFFVSLQRDFFCLSWKEERDPVIVVVIITRARSWT